MPLIRFKGFKLDAMDGLYQTSNTLSMVQLDYLLSSQSIIWQIGLDGGKGRTGGLPEMRRGNREPKG
jgi:hypothetical protein